MTRFEGSFEPIVVTTRSGLEESLHYGAGVAIDSAGDVLAAVGDQDVIIYPRSSLKPLQASTMIECGLDVPAPLLAIVCASHDGSAVHLNAVRQLLDRFELQESDLQNTATRPLDKTARSLARAAGIEPSALQQNCSGKHAGMLATCRINGWDIETYMEFDHPLQAAITSRMSECGCTVHHVGVDGCGAPTHALELRQLARAFSVIVAGSSPIARAMASNPDLVGGPERDVSLWMKAVPGLMVKDGADGVMVAAMPDGRAAAFKIADGSTLARQAVMVAALRAMGVDVEARAAATASRVEVEVYGHGRKVGVLEPLEWAT